MIEDNKSFEKEILRLKRCLEDSKKEARYFRNIAEESGKRRLKEIHHLSELISERKQIEKTLRSERNKLQEALAKIKSLSGLLPLCSCCKKIRDDQGYWKQLESYISDHSEAEFSHSLCPACAMDLYPEYFKKKVNY